MSQINELKANIYSLQENTNGSSIVNNPFSSKTNTTSLISNITTNNNSIITNNNINNKSVISNNTTNNNTITNRNASNENKEEIENSDYFDKRIVKHAPIKRQPLGKRSSLVDSEDLVSELKN